MERLIEILKKELSSSSHDLDHTFRVLNVALKIAQFYPEANVEVIKVACILHDIARVREDKDPERRIDHAVLGAEMSRKILKELGYNEDFIEAVAHAIESHRYRGKSKPKTIEAMILSDADKLDAIGAIGVARSFMIAGEYGEPLFKEFNENEAGEASRIRDFKDHSPNIEYEVKLKHIKDRLYTDVAKRIAEDRTKFMEVFFERLKKEVKGEL